jgi:signal transduction histidine kinase
MPYFSKGKPGTGLGLAIVHRIMTDHGGQIRVEGNRPKGARFIMELPLAQNTGGA